MDIQTDTIPTVNEILQAECADYEENGIQTDLAECLNESVQTFPTQPEVTEDESQTDVSSPQDTRADSFKSILKFLYRGTFVCLSAKVSRLFIAVMVQQIRLQHIKYIT